MKISFFEVEDWEKEYLEKRLAGHEIFSASQKLNLGNIKDCQILSTFIYSKLSKEILEKLPSLKFITTRSTGFDHIDLKFCKEKGVLVANVPIYGIDTVAEHTFALILAISKNLIRSVEQARKGNFSLENLCGFALAGKTIGIIGLGHVGTRVAEIAQCFKMKILIHTRHPNQKEGLEAKFTDLPTLLKNSDIITLHVPLTPETKHLINLQNINFVKKGAILINTARGAVVETEAIVYALEKGILAYAGLDVLEEECALKEEPELLSSEFLKTCNLKTQLLNHVLLKKENCLVTPHNAFNSYEALEEILKTTVNNIQAFLAGHPQNLVTL